MKLYEITKEFKEIEKLEDIPQEAIDDTLEAIKGEFQDKGLAVLAYILNEESTLEALESHKKRIDEKIKSIKNRTEKLKDYLRHNMEVCGIKKIECDLFKASLGKPSKIVELVDEDLIPKEYKKEKITISISKADIKKALDNGDDVPGVKLSEGKSRLTIK